MRGSTILKAEGGYQFIDLANDKNTVYNGEVTTYYANGKEKWHGKYVNGKRDALDGKSYKDNRVGLMAKYNF